MLLWVEEEESRDSSEAAFSAKDMATGATLVDLVVAARDKEWDQAAAQDSPGEANDTCADEVLTQRLLISNNGSDLRLAHGAEDWSSASCVLQSLEFVQVPLGAHQLGDVGAGGWALHDNSSRRALIHILSLFI